MGKFSSSLKKNTSNIILLIAAIILIFSTDAKALLSQGLMKLGFYQPSFSQEIKRDTEYLNSNWNIVDADGNSVNVTDLKGKLVFLNFWATWCPPCVAEMPSIQKLYENFQFDDEVVFLLVEMDGEPHKAIDFMNKKGFSLPVYSTNERVPEELYKGNLPTTVILNKEGQIVYQTFGLADYSGNEFREFIRNLK
jgi:thiol-disulfide isomerase/thioredoxin